MTSLTELHKPVIVWIDHETASLEKVLDTVRKLKRVRGDRLREIGDLLDFVPICLTLDGSLPEQAAAKINGMRRHPDLVMVDFCFGDPGERDSFEVGRALARTLRDLVAPARVGIYTRHDLSPRKRTLLSTDGFALVLEDFNDICKAVHDQPPPLDGDDWWQLFDNAIGRRHPTKVMIVFGRNTVAEQAVRQFLRAVNLEPISWNNMRTSAGDPSEFVGRIVESGFAMGHAAVVVLTPDEDSKLRSRFAKSADEGRPRPQPRPNVLIEAGMALALFPRKTILVKIGDVGSLPSDLGGRDVLKMDNTPEKRLEFIQRLKSVGCAVDDSSKEWLAAGDFQSAIDAARCDSGDDFAQP